MKKNNIRIIIVLFCALVLCFCAKRLDYNIVPDADPQMIDMSSLIFDQGHTYISLSKNNDNGFNRWFPLYFRIKGNIDCTENEIEQALNKQIKKLSLTADDGTVIYLADELMWSALKLPNGIINLSLMISLTDDCFRNKEQMKIQTITFLLNNNEIITYYLEHCVIEERDTLNSDNICVYESTIDTTYSEDLTALVDYGIQVKNGVKVASVEIDYPEYFADLDKYEIFTYNTNDDDECYSLTIAYHFLLDHPKTMFRPFIKIVFEDGNTGWIIPPLPVFIH